MTTRRFLKLGSSLVASLLAAAAIAGCGAGSSNTTRSSARAPAPRIASPTAASLLPCRIPVGGHSGCGSVVRAARLPTALKAENQRAAP
jgi:hypothetical protein